MTITPEQFITQPEPDEELEAFESEILTEWSGADPLTLLAESLRRIEARLDEPPVPVVPAQDFDDAMQALADLGAKHDELYALLEEIEALLKPSTSKLANSVRDAITRWRAPEVPVEPAAELPAHDASVEVWQAYALSVSDDPHIYDMNRSQIRTLLGIEQPA